jgi:PadR family transcriptional regulator PadR
MRIRAEIEQRGDRKATIGAVYATLERLQAKGYVRQIESAGGSERSGLARRFYSLTPAGKGALEEARDLQARMWAGLRIHVQRRRV